MREQHMPLQITILHSDHLELLLEYLHALSPQSKQRFAPHPAEAAATWAFYHWQQQNIGYIGIMDNKIIAYFIIKRSYLAHDKERLERYGLTLHALEDFTLAPSVAEAWQGKGIAGKMMEYVLADVRNRGAKRLFLWGGVQCDNTAAVKFYEKHGFVALGTFEYNGCNKDMMLHL